MRKVLSINSNPGFRTYTYHAYYHAIVSAPSKLGKKVAQIQVESFNNYEWSELNKELNWDRERNKLTFYSENEYNRNLNACFWRNLQEDDEIRLKIDYQQYTNPWGAINIFITNKSQTNMLEDDDYWIRLGNFCKDGVYARINNITQNMKVSKDVEFQELKIICRNKTVNMYVNNSIVLSAQIPEEKGIADLCIGFEIKLNNNVYYDWLFSNYIQIYSNIESSDDHIDYFGKMKKNWAYYTADYFLDYKQYTYDVIEEMGISIEKFIKCNIDQGNYIEVWINQIFLKERWEYSEKVNHFHQNLIYGYDDEKGIFLLVGYLKRIPSVTEISYDDFCCKQNLYGGNRNVIVITYNPDSVIFEFSVDYCRQMLSQYIDSTNSYLMYGSLMKSQVDSFGLDIYKQLCTKKGIEVLFDDIRIIHFLVEHKYYMKDRVMYLIYCKYLVNDVDRWIDKMNVIVQLANNLKTVVLMGRVKKNEKYITHARDILNEISQHEQEYYSMLLNEL